LLLNGDIVDLWLTTFEFAQESPLFKYLLSLSFLKPVIWVLGNHDTRISTGSNIQIVDSFVTGPSKDILIIHGHQAYKGGNTSIIDKMLYRLVFWAWRLFACDLQIKLNETKLYKRYINLKRLKILKIFSAFRHIIMGHTHVAGILEHNQTILIDTGSCPITRSYVIIDGDSVQLKYF
jgi:predicted phosphodiesterase